MKISSNSLQKKNFQKITFYSFSSQHPSRHCFNYIHIPYIFYLFILFMWMVNGWVVECWMSWCAFSKSFVPFLWFSLFFCCHFAKIELSVHISLLSKLKRLWHRFEHFLFFIFEWKPKETMNKSEMQKENRSIRCKTGIWCTVFNSHCFVVGVCASHHSKIKTDNK